jgi:MFS family permease
LVSLFWNGIGFIILRQMSEFNAIAVTIFLVAVVGEAFRPASIMAFTEVCPPEMRARGIVLNRLASNLGIAFGPAIGGFLATINYGLIFWVDGMTCIAAGILFFIRFRKEPVRRAGSDDHMQERRSPWRDGVMLSFLGILLILGITFNQIFNTWPVFLREIHQIPEHLIGLLLTINCLLLLVFEMPLIHRLEKRNPLPVIMTGTLFLFSGFILLPFGQGYAYMALTVILWTLGEMLVLPLSATFIVNRAGEGSRGRYMGAFTLTFSMAFVLAPVAGSYFYTAMGPRLMWMNTGWIGLMVFLGFFGIYKYLNCCKHLEA